MPQQINLCTPLALAERQSFTAKTMAQALAVFVVLGGVLGMTYLWNISKASVAYNATLADQARDIQGLKTALEASRRAAAPLDAAMTQQLQAKRAELARRQQLLAGLNRGLYAPGGGHSDRLQLLARTIPDVVWLSDVKADSQRMEVSGFTLEPAALNEWVARMAPSPLMQGLKLGGVQVENMQYAANTGAPAQAASAVQRPTWSFTLVSVMPQSGAPVEGKP